MRKTSYLVGLGVAAAVTAGALITSPATVRSAGQGNVLEVDPVPLIAETAGGERSFTVEIADDTRERQVGLMHRETMADDHGMLFVFERSQNVAFWMKDTPMPLDLIFIGQDGVVRDIKRGTPLSEAVISPDEPVRFVLELKAGTARRQGIADGDRIRHPAIDTPPNGVGG